MPSVQVKDFPQNLYDELKAFAELNHRSMSQQLVVAAERMLHQPPSPSVSTEQAAGGRHNTEDDEERRLARRAKRLALFARIDASAEEAARRGTWNIGGLDTAELVNHGREGHDRAQGWLLDRAPSAFVESGRPGESCKFAGPDGFDVPGNPNEQREGGEPASSTKPDRGDARDRS